MNTSTPQDTYYSLVHVMRKQKDYFKHMSPENILKLAFYCYSFAQTNSFSLGDKMLNNIGFAVLFFNSGDPHQEDCENCSGNGELSCDVCDGNGKIDCDTCDESGEMQCPYCEGEGQIEDDGEMVKCDECDGATVLTCDDCSGEGRKDCDNCNYGQVTCDECDGNGQVETDSFDYTRYFIVTWNKSIKDRCEYTENDSDIVMSEYDFDRLRDEYIKLKIDEKWAELSSWVQSNELYCYYYDDNPKMFLTDEMELQTNADNIDPYTR